MITVRDRIIGSIVGCLVGDALGVPVEFSGRNMRDHDPVTGMRGHGTWDQPAGTWSDDGAMTMVAAETLATHGWSLKVMMDGFLRWMDEAWWTARGEVFDIGIRTRNSLSLFRIDHDIADCGGTDEMDNGNGSLMRCLPISLWLAGEPTTERVIALASEASALTHAHPRSRLCCAWHALWCRNILTGMSDAQALSHASVQLRPHIPPAERKEFRRILDGSVLKLPRAGVVSGGYVISTLEASLWCQQTPSDFASATLAAVNLGGDTDTTACVTGGMSGLRHGIAAIPPEWIASLARTTDICSIAESFADACTAHWLEVRHGS